MVFKRAVVVVALCATVAFLSGCDDKVELELRKLPLGIPTGPPRNKQCMEWEDEHKCSIVNKDCDYDHTPGCPISGFEKNDKWTWVFPRGNTLCMQEDQPFGFQVYNGDPDKLLINFAGGGICWDWLTTNMPGGIPGSPDNGMCSQRMYQQDSIGIFNRTNPANPFQNYSVLHINYCDGGAHASNAANSMQQRGYRNARAAVDWAKKNFPGPLTKFAIAGQSAGSLATQLWASTLLTEFPADDRMVLPDSFMGVMPDGVQTGVFHDLGLCTTPLLNEKRCDDSITVQQVFVNAMDKFPDVTFGQVQSKGDIIQYSLAKALGLLKGDWGFYRSFTEAMFLRRVNQIAHVYMTRKNYRFFIINGKMHTFTGWEDHRPNLDQHGNRVNYYDVDAECKTCGGANSMLLNDWVALIESGKTVKNECFGGIWENPTDLTYCLQTV